MNDHDNLIQFDEYNILQSFNRLKKEFNEPGGELSNEAVSNMASAVLLSSTLDHWGERLIEELLLLRQSIESLGCAIDNLDHSELIEDPD